MFDRNSFSRHAVLAGAALVLAAGTVHGQAFQNGDFASGDFTGWMISNTANGQSLVQVVEMFDIDGPGPLEPSNAARFQVGQVTFTSGIYEGIEIVQPLNLEGGTQYEFGFDWAAIRETGGSNSDGGRFAIIVDGVELTFHATGSTSPTLPHYGQLRAFYTPPSTGVYMVGARIMRRFLATNMVQYVDNFIPSGPVVQPCYANCDGSTVEPILNVDDFTCFINEFAAAQAIPHAQQVTHYANCDGSTVAPVLNVDDFTCFINQFAQGCP